MSIIRGPIFISAVSLPVAIFAFCLRGILRGIFDFRGIFCLRGTRACGRSRRMRPPCSAVALQTWLQRDDDEGLCKKVVKNVPYWSLRALN